MRRIAAKTDANHTEVREALRKIGASVQDLAPVGKGCPDLLVGFRDLNILIEVKDGDKVPSKRELTADQRDWHGSWAGQVTVVESAEQAVLMVIEAAKRQGKV